MFKNGVIMSLSSIIYFLTWLAICIVWFLSMYDVVSGVCVETTTQIFSILGLCDVGLIQSSFADITFPPVRPWFLK